jgi:hypothetical protein
MSDTVDNVMDTVSEASASGADEPAEVVVSEEAPVASASETEAAEPAVEEPEPVVEEPEPVASASETEAAEPAPSAPAPSEPVSTQEVVQNVQEILSSTETNVSGNDLEERVKVLEERLESLVQVLKESWICNPGCSMDKQLLYNKINELH